MAPTTKTHYLYRHTILQRLHQGSTWVWDGSGRSKLHPYPSTPYPHRVWLHTVPVCKQFGKKPTGCQEPTVCSHRPPSIDPGLGQWRGGTENAKAETHYTTKPPPLQPQATFIDPGSGQWRGGTENAKAEACQQEDTQGKKWWEASYAT